MADLKKIMTRTPERERSALFVVSPSGDLPDLDPEPAQPFGKLPTRRKPRPRTPEQEIAFLRSELTRQKEELVKKFNAHLAKVEEDVNRQLAARLADQVNHDNSVIAEFEKNLVEVMAENEKLAARIAELETRADNAGLEKAYQLAQVLDENLQVVLDENQLLHSNIAGLNDLVEELRSRLRAEEDSHQVEVARLRRKLNEAEAAVAVQDRPERRKPKNRDRFKKDRLTDRD